MVLRDRALEGVRMVELDRWAGVEVRCSTRAGPVEILFVRLCERAHIAKTSVADLDKHAEEGTYLPPGWRGKGCRP